MANSSFNLAELNDNNGFIINGIGQADFLGRSVSGIGDINGDGIADIIIGADGRDLNINIQESGASYGIVICNPSPEEGFCSSVSSVGDFNGDGIDDLIIGAPYADVNNNNNAARSFIVFGSRNVQRLRSSGINGSEANGLSGYSVSGVLCVSVVYLYRALRRRKGIRLCLTEKEYLDLSSTLLGYRLGILAWRCDHSSFLQSW